MPQKLLDWPSQSPDINPIENLFAWIKYQLIKLPHRRPVSCVLNSLVLLDQGYRVILTH